MEQRTCRFVFLLMYEEEYGQSKYLERIIVNIWVMEEYSSFSD